MTEGAVTSLLTLKFPPRRTTQGIGVPTMQALWPSLLRSAFTEDDGQLQLSSVFGSCFTFTGSTVVPLAVFDFPAELQLQTHAKQTIYICLPCAGTFLAFQKFQEFSFSQFKICFVQFYAKVMLPMLCSSNKCLQPVNELPRRSVL